MVIDAVRRSTLQGYAILGSKLIELIYAQESSRKAKKILRQHQERVVNALSRWQEPLSEEHISNIHHVLTYDEDACVYDPTASSTTVTDHVISTPAASKGSKGSSKGTSTSKGKSSGIDENIGEAGSSDEDSGHEQTED